MSVVRKSPPGTHCFGIALTGLALTGCMPKATSKPVLPQPPATQLTEGQGTDAGPQRRRNLDHAAGDLTDDAKKLPGHSAAEHIEAIQRVFNDLIQVLPLLRNDNTDRVLGQRLAVIKSSRAQLASGFSGLAMEPAIDTGLRAASGALADISHGDSFDGADIGPDLDKLSARINGLDLERDSSLHRIDVADAVDLMSTIVSKLVVMVGGQAAGGLPATAPATSAPTTAPAASAKD